MSIMFTRMSFTVAVAFATLLAVASASAQKITYDSAKGTDFSIYKTYKWQRADDARYPDATSDRILMKTIDEQLSAKGLTRTDSDTADVFVIYQIAITNDIEWSTFTNNIGWEGGANSLAGFSGATTNSSDIIRKGWLLIDIYDVKLKKQVWQASVTKTLAQNADAKKMEQNARKAMAKVFKMYPPPAK